MAKVAKYRPKGGVNAEDVPEGEHEAVIKDTDTVILLRAKRGWDKKKVGTVRSQDFEH